jgi:hypothetical protein
LTGSFPRLLNPDSNPRNPFFTAQRNNDGDVVWLHFETSHSVVWASEAGRPELFWKSDKKCLNIAHYVFNPDKNFWSNIFFNSQYLTTIVQRDQIGRIFAKSVIVYFGKLFRNYRINPNVYVGYYFPRLRLCINFVEKCVGLDFRGYFLKLIRSP